MTIVPATKPTLVMISIGDSNARANAGHPGRQAVHPEPRFETLRWCH
jgi:hypothetical protein